MTDVEKKDYSHLTNTQIVELLSKYRLLNFEDFPEEFKDIDFPRGHDLLTLISYRLKLADLADYTWIDPDKLEELNKHST